MRPRRRRGVGNVDGEEEKQNAFQRIKNPRASGEEWFQAGGRGVTVNGQELILCCVLWKRRSTADGVMVRIHH